jgi:hypothetical protein
LVGWLVGWLVQEIKFKTTKLIEGAKGGRCAVTRTPDTGFTFLCAAVTRNLVLMQWCWNGHLCTGMNLWLTGNLLPEKKKSIK